MSSGDLEVDLHGFSASLTTRNFLISKFAREITIQLKAGEGKLFKHRERLKYCFRQY